MSKKKAKDIIENIDSKEKEKNEETIDEMVLLTDKIQELEEKVIRNQSEFQNLKRRTEEKEIQYITQANSSLIGKLLIILDNFDIALNIEVDDKLKNYFEGFKLVQKNMLDILENEGLKEINGVNQPFDPEIHEAVSIGNDSKKDNDIVLEVLQKGYKLNGKLLRPAMVKVNKKGGKENE